jgi:MinD-like ATPase involved in chromosome partitioning or flagellar assembly
MGKIISIHSFRGGTGKSNITANLAALAALQGKRVGVVDTDIQSPGIHVLFGLDETKMGHTLNQFLRGECGIKDVAHPVGAEGQEGVQQLTRHTIWLVPSSINGSEISKVVKTGYSVDVLNRGLNALRKELNLDYLFIDTHPGLNEETLLSVALSDTLVVIMRPDQQDYQGTIVTVDIARQLDVPNLFIVVNKSLISPELKEYDMLVGNFRNDIEARYNSKVAGILPLSVDMAQNASKDIFALRYPDHAWSKAVREAADIILAA